MTTNQTARHTTSSSQEDAARKVVLVTGASSGIGEAIARRLAAEGHTVVLTGRRADRLRAVADELTGDGHSADARTLDVTDRAAFAALVSDVIAAHGRLDVLVGNAGVMLLSRLDSLLVDEWDRMIDVNVRGLCNGFAAVLPHFRDRRSGHVVTIASIGAHEVSPTSAVYSATKYAAWALAEGLRQEADPSIRVTTVSPGVVESELADHITDAHAADLMVGYRAALLPADAVARAVAYAIDQPADVDVNEIVVRPAAQR
ncbi:SDR family oxidoreductase [Marinactinospora endophytica]